MRFVPFGNKRSNHGRPAVDDQKNADPAAVQSENLRPEGPETHKPKSIQQPNATQPKSPEPALFNTAKSAGRQPTDSRHGTRNEQPGSNHPETNHPEHNRQGNSNGHPSPAHALPHNYLIRQIVCIVVIVACAVPAAIAINRTSMVKRAKALYSSKLKYTAHAAIPALLERENGYHPVGEVQLPNKRDDDHVVRIVKAGSTDKYVCWTTGSEQAATLTLPGAQIRVGSIFGNNQQRIITGPSAAIRILLRHRPTVVLGTPYVNDQHVINAADAGLVSDSAYNNKADKTTKTINTTDNTRRLNTILALLPTTVHKTISFPTGHFSFTGVIRMASNVTMLGVASKTFIQQPTHHVGRLVIWYPTGRARGYDGMHDVTWKNMYFQGRYANRTPIQPIFQSIIHASNITFDGCTFKMIQGHLSHLLDVDGSTNVTVRNSTVIGSADQGQTFKEVFQMDVAALGATGYNDPDTVLNNLPTTHMTIEHNDFLPLRDNRGKLILPAPAPFGTHMAYAPTPSDSSYIRYGVFKDNYVEDPVSYEGAGTENSAVIHFDAADNITIDHNTFVWTGETPQPSWAVALYARSWRMVKPKEWHGITITDNVFKRFAPNRGAFALYREANSVSVPGESVTQVVVSGNKFEGTPVRLALQWLHHYSTMFIATYDQQIIGSNNVADGTIHLDGGDTRIHRG